MTSQAAIDLGTGDAESAADVVVLDVFGMPVGGLFAAGDCLGGLSATADLGGTRISGGFTLGRLAGRAAASGVDDTAGRGSVQGAFLPSRLGARIALVHLGAHES